MLTVLIVFLIVAVATAVAAAMGRCPLWIPVIALCVVEAVQILPLKVTPERATRFGRPFLHASRGTHDSHAHVSRGHRQHDALGFFRLPPEVQEGLH